MKDKIWLLSLLVLLMLLMLLLFLCFIVGCNTNTPDADPETKEETEEITENDSAGDVSGGTMILATTTSTYDSGLLGEILPIFEEIHNIKVEVISVGTGQAMKIGQRGDCDIILVHARALEDRFVADGYGTQRRDVMYNDFVFLGPADDPAGLAGSANLTEALENMTAHLEAEGINFLSRGDNSGTHNKEIALWPIAGIDDFESREWYNSMGQGMGDTLIAANEMQGYALTDRSTYLSMKGNLPNLGIVFAGDDNLFNPYGIIPVNPALHEGVKHDKAMLLVEFFISEDIQQKIGEYGVEEFGQPLFFPDA